jgi:hypothetical protein
VVGAAAVLAIEAFFLLGWSINKPKQIQVPGGGSRNSTSPSPQPVDFLKGFVGEKLEPKWHDKMLYGKNNANGKQVYDYTIWLNLPANQEVANVVRAAIKSVTYDFGNAWFDSNERYRISSDSKDSYSVSYEGWGQLSDVGVVIKLVNGEEVRKEFAMSDATRGSEIPSTGPAAAGPPQPTTQK